MENRTITPDSRRQLRNRIFFLVILFIIIMLALVFKTAHIQVFQESYYKRFAQGQIEQRVIVPAVRGQISDRNGTVITDSRPSYSLNITPAYFPKDKVKRKLLVAYLSKKLNISKETLIDRITIRNRLKQNKYRPILVKRDLTEKLYTELKENEARLQGVSVELLATRRYLLKDSLSHVLGYTGIIDKKAWRYFQNKYKETPNTNPYEYQGTIIGKLGIERYHDKDLKGKDGLATRLINSKGQPIPDTTQIIKKPTAGNNIYLTIDANLQKEAKKLMQNKTGALIASKPNTGEILAIVSNPSFNANDIISRQTDKIKKINLHESKLFFNRAIRAAYPPSSIFKLIVAIAALEEDKVSLKKKIFCTGAFRLGNRVFKCHRIHGNVNFIQAIEQSCNYYFYNLALEIGWETIYKYAKLFNLDTKHILEFGSSIKGIIPNAEWKKKQFSEIWFPGDTLNHAIGQGYIILSPIQIHNIISIIATGGVLYKPYIIHHIDNPITRTTTFSKKKIIKKIIFKERTIQVIKKALRGVIARGTGYYGRFSKKHLILGKTGTAQNTGGYDHAWFTSYAVDSADPNNQIAISIIVENANNHGGGFVSAPIATALIRYHLANIPISVTQKQMGRLLYSKKVPDDIEKESHKIALSTKTKKDKAGIDSFLKHEDSILGKIKDKHIAFSSSIERDTSSSAIIRKLRDNTYTNKIIDDALVQNINLEQDKIEKEGMLLLKQKRRILKKQQKQQDILVKKEKKIRVAKEKEKKVIEQKIKREERKQAKPPSYRKKASPKHIELERLKKIVDKESTQFIKDTDDFEFLD